MEGKLIPMSQIFDIDQSFIKAVDDETARELVARLCRAELRTQRLPESAVSWGGDQRAKDSGIDVCVDCPSPLRRPDFVRTACTVFQVKAEKFAPSKIQAEMAPMTCFTNMSAMEMRKWLRPLYVMEIRISIR